MDTRPFIPALALACGCGPARAPELDEPTPAPALVVEADLDAPPTVAEPVAEPPPGFVPLTRGQDSCEVQIVAILEAEEYRGPGPLTPSVAASLDADPDYAQFYNSASHGDHHIQCHYEVRLGHLPDARFRWRTVHGNTLREHTPALCEAPEQVAAAAEDIIDTTKQCTDFDAGAYWGYVLEPL